MKQSKKAGRLKALSLFSIVLAVAIAGTASMASADGIPGIPEPHNQFYGTITLNGVDAPAGTIVCAYISGELRGSVEAAISGSYGYDKNYLSVQGNGDEVISFTVAGAPAAETATWIVMSGPRKLNLTAEGVASTECLGTCCNDSACTDTFAENVSCSGCIAEGGYWHPNENEACFDNVTPYELCLDWCPECCDGVDNDDDNNTDYSADGQCTCGLDPSETTKMPPVPELPTFALTGIGILGIALVMARKRE